MALAYARLRELRQVLDPCFAPIGFRSDPSTTGFVVYQGVLDGRAVTVRCSVNTRYRYISSGISYRRFAGISLEMTVATRLKTRLVVSLPLRLALAGADNIVVRAVIRGAEWRTERRHGFGRVTIPRSEGAAVRARAIDTPWARQFLTMEIRRLLRDLLPARDLATLDRVNVWSLLFFPGGMRLSITPRAATITPANVARWIRTTLTVLQRAEQTSPTVTSEPSPHEFETKRGSRPIMSLSPMTVGLVLCGIVAVPCALVVAGLVAYAILGEAALLIPIVFMFFFMPYAMYLVARNALRAVSGAGQRSRSGEHWSQAGQQDRPTVPSST